MKVLVTGGAGFIGSNIVGELLRRNYSVRVLDNFSTGRRQNIKEFEKDIELVEGDIRSYHTVNHAVQGIDIILHQAALPSVPRSIHDPITTNEVNVGGTLNILDAAKNNNVQRLVFASSSSVYGDNPVLPKVETMQPNPLSPYAVSKLTGEYYLKVFNRLYGLETIALRYFNVFGPKQDPNSQYSAVIPKFIKAIRQGDQPVIYGDGEQSRDFTFVANVIEANMLAMDKKVDQSLIMNCSAGINITLNKLADKINNILGKNTRINYEKPRPGDIKHSFGDINLIGTELGYKPKVNFDDGLKQVCQYFEKQ